MRLRVKSLTVATIIAPVALESFSMSLLLTLLTAKTPALPKEVKCHVVDAFLAEDNVCT